MEQIKREQLLFSAGELLELEAVGFSGVFSPKAQSDNQAAQICAYMETPGHAFLWKLALVLSLPPQLETRLPEDKELCFLLSMLSCGL